MNGLLERMLSELQSEGAQAPGSSELPQEIPDRLSPDPMRDPSRAARYRLWGGQFAERCREQGKAEFSAEHAALLGALLGGLYAMSRGLSFERGLGLAGMGWLAGHLLSDFLPTPQHQLSPVPPPEVLQFVMDQPDGALFLEPFLEGWTAAAGGTGQGSSVQVADPVGMLMRVIRG